MKVLLVYANPVLVPMANPYGLEILHESLANTGWQITLYCPFMYGDYPYQHAATFVRKLQPDFVAISIRNLDDCTALPSMDQTGFEMGSYLQIIRKLVNSIKQVSPRANFLLGGAGFSFCPELLLKELDVNYGFLGPGEKGFYRLIVLSEQYGSIDAIPVKLLQSIQNIIFKRDGTFYRGNISYKLQDESTFNFINRDPGFLMVEKFTKGYIPVRTKSGCSLHCSYCVVPLGEHLSWRPVRNVIDELYSLVTNSEDSIRVFFADGEFNLPSLKHPKDLLKRIIQQHLNEQLQWVSYFTVKPFDNDFITLLKKSNCTGISLTLDSFSDQVLAMIGKDFRKQEVITLLNSLIRADISTIVNIIFGLPNETEQTIEETLKLVEVYAQKGIRFSLSVGARVYPNTPLVNYIINNNRYQHVYGNTNTQYLSPVLYCEPNSPSEITKTVLESVGQLQTVNVMNLNGVYKTAHIYHKERKALTRGYYFLGKKEYKEAIKWFRMVTRKSGPYKVNAFWALALIFDELGNHVVFNRYITEIIKCERKWPHQIDYDSVRQLLSS